MSNQPESQNDFEPAAAAAEKRLRINLRHSAGVQSQVAADLRRLEVAAPLHQRKLRRLLPELEKAIEDSPDEESRANAEREYLQAKSNIERCEQCFQMARRNRVIVTNS